MGNTPPFAQFIHQKPKSWLHNKILHWEIEKVTQATENACEWLRCIYKFEEALFPCRKAANNPAITLPNYFLICQSSETRYRASPVIFSNRPPSFLNICFPNYIINIAVMRILKRSNFGTISCSCHSSVYSLTLGKFTGFTHRSKSYFSRRNETVHRKARDIESHFLNCPCFFHPSFSVAHCCFSKPEKGYNWTTRVSNHYSLNRPIIIEEGIDCGLPIHRIPSIVLNAGQMGVFQVHKESCFLAEVSKQDVSYDLCWPFTPCFQCHRICAKFEDETILSIDLLLSSTSCIGKHTRSGSGVKSLKTIRHSTVIIEYQCGIWHEALR